METVSVDVAPSFATNFRARLQAALKPQRILTFILALGFLGYLAVTHPLPEVKRIAVLVMLVLLLMRVGVIALASIVTKHARARYTMRLDFSDATIVMVNSAGTQDVGWDYVRRVTADQSGAILDLRTGYYVPIDFKKTANARALVEMFRRQRLLS